MTTKEKLIAWMVGNGMFEDQAQEVFNLVRPALEIDGYRITWDRPAEEYPNAMYAVWILTLKPIALAWIDENCPMAWFRPMFTSDPEAAISDKAAGSGS